jgi:D-glycero-D-manno-heptose 1,7-bisphosphate phosphatase
VRRAIFLDRDGVINFNRDSYVTSWQEFVFLPGVFAPLRQLAESCLAVVVVSNQSAVARGLISTAELETIHRQMIEAVEHQGGRLDAVFYCPHHPEEGCSCRKPQPGLLLRAAAHLDLDLSSSFVVGDAESDVEAALNAGCKPVLVLTGRGQDQLTGMPPQLVAQCHVAKDLGAAVAWIVQQCEAEEAPVPGHNAALW